MPDLQMSGLGVYKFIYFNLYGGHLSPSFQIVYTVIYCLLILDIILYTVQYFHENNIQSNCVTELEAELPFSRLA